MSVQNEQHDEACTDLTDTATESVHRKPITPQPLDVILGRGKSYGKHPGNKIYQDHVQLSRSRYFESPFAAKRDIISEVIDVIQSRGGRFLQLTDDTWTIAPDSKVRLKISHAIQYHIRTELSQIKQSVSTSVHNIESIPEGGLSDHDHITKNFQEKIAKLQNESSLSALPTFFHSMGNPGSTVTVTSEHSRVTRQDSSNTTPSNLMQEKEIPYLSAFDHINNEVSDASYRSPVVPPGYHFVDMNQAGRNNLDMFPTPMQPLQPFTDTDVCRLRQIQHASQTNMDHGFNYPTAHAPFVSDVIDNMQFQQSAAPHINYFLERAIADYMNFKQSSEYGYHIGSRHCDPRSNSIMASIAEDHQQVIQYQNEVPIHPKNLFPDEVGNSIIDIDIINDNKAPPRVENELDTSGVRFWNGLVSFVENNGNVDARTNDDIIIHHQPKGSVNDRTTEEYVEELPVVYGDTTDSESTSLHEPQLVAPTPQRPLTKLDGVVAVPTYTTGNNNIQIPPFLRADSFAVRRCY